MSLAPQDPGYEARVRRVFDRQGLMEAFGVGLQTVGPGICALRVGYHGSRAKLQSTIQGALLGAMADTAASLAVLTLVPKGHGVVAAEYKVNFLEAALGDYVEARAKVRRYGRTLSLVEVDTVSVSEADGSEILCAFSTHTIMRLDPPKEEAAKPASAKK